MHRQPLDTKIQPQLFKQKSPAIDITNATTVQHQPTSSISDQQTLLSKNSHAYYYREMMLVHACMMPISLHELQSRLMRLREMLPQSLRQHNPQNQVNNYCAILLCCGSITCQLLLVTIVTTETEEIDTTQSISAQPTKHGTF